VPNVENARDFVVLLGPGDENSTSDKGGRFVYTPAVGERAARGRNAGSLLAQLLPGIGGGPGTTVSRTGYAVASDPLGNVYGPFPSPPNLTQGFTSNLSAQPASGSKGKASDANAQEANNVGDANSLSGNTIAEAGGQISTLLLVENIQDDGGDDNCPACETTGQFSFDQLRQISTGSASLSGSGLNIGDVFSVSSFFFQLNFSNQQLQFDLNGISGGGLSSGQIGCFSSCAVNYGALDGTALFTPEIIASQANLTRSVGCDDCFVTIGVVDASATDGALLNVRLVHTAGPGNVPADATTQVNLAN
jgi:hypothetical protein